jgi:hypothetical protein
MVFERVVGGESVMVMLNAAERAAEVAVPAPRDGEWRELLNGDAVVAAGGKLRTVVPAGWGRILRAG